MPINAIYQGPSDLPEVIPVFPLPGALLLPRGQMPLNIFEPRYMEMVDDALASRHRLIGMIQPDSGHPGPEDRPNLFKVGCVGRITQIGASGSREQQSGDCDGEACDANRLSPIEMAIQSARAVPCVDQHVGNACSDNRASRPVSCRNDRSDRERRNI